MRINHGRKQQGPIFLTWINLNPGKDKWSQAHLIVEWNYLSIVKLQRLHCWSLRMDG